MVLKKHKRLAKAKEYFFDHKQIIGFIAVWIVILVAISLLQPVFFGLIEEHQDLKETYQFVLSQLDRHSYVWLLIIVSIGALFLIGIPVDFVVFAYLLTGANVWYTAIAYLLGVLIGRSINYFVGRLFSRVVIEKIIKKEYKEFSRKYARIASAVLFFGNFIPLFPMDLFTGFAGTIKYPYWKLLLYQSLAYLIKIFIIISVISYLTVSGVPDLNMFTWIKDLLMMVV